jgi:hypothetical protein
VPTNERVVSTTEDGQEAAEYYEEDEDGNRFRVRNGYRTPVFKVDEGEEDKALLEQQEKDEDEAEDNNNSSLEKFIKSVKDKEEVDKVSSTTKEETPTVTVLPNNNSRTPAQTEFMRVMNIMMPILDKPNMILKQFPGVQGVTPHLSIRKERAPIYTALLPVIREHNLTAAEVITQLIIKYAQEKYTDYLTPAETKTKRQREEQERAAKEFEDNFLEYIEKANSRELTREEVVKKLAPTMTHRDFHIMTVNAETNYRLMLDAAYNPAVKFRKITEEEREREEALNKKLEEEVEAKRKRKAAEPQPEPIQQQEEQSPQQPQQQQAAEEEEVEEKAWEVLYKAENLEQEDPPASTSTTTTSSVLRPSQLGYSSYYDSLYVD